MLETEPQRTPLGTIPDPPPKGPARAAGGLLGVMVGDTWRATGPPTRMGSGSRTTAALVELSRSYAARGAAQTPAAVAADHAGVPAPAWLLPVAIIKTTTPSLVGDTVKLAALATVSGVGLPACVTYAKIATYLLAAYPAPEAIALATGRPVPEGSGMPSPTGRSEADALRLAVWALSRPERMDEILGTMASTAPRPARAAAGGLLGLRDGLDGIPQAWHQDPDSTDRCLALAYGLLRARACEDPNDPT